MAQGSELRWSCRRRRSSAAHLLLKCREARFQSVDGLLFVRDLLLEVLQLSQACGVVFIAGFGVDVVLLQSEITLEQIQIFLCVGELLFDGRKFSGGLCLFLRIIGSCGWSGCF